MRVLYVSKASAVAAHRDKLRALAERVDLVPVIPRRWNGREADPPLPGEPEPIRLPTWASGHNHLHVYRGLSRVFGHVRPDLVHVDEEPYSAVTLQAGRLAHEMRTPFVFFAWQNIDKRLPLPFRWLRRRVYASAAGGIAGSAAGAEVLRSSGFEGPLAVIPQMGVDPARFAPDPTERAAWRARIGVAHDDVLVGYVGRLVAEKGVDTLLDAMTGVSARVLLVGSGPHEATLRARADASGIAGRTIFAGEAPSLEVPRWLRALDVLVLPSRTTNGWKEQFGRVLVEAMSCGVPVVGSDSGEIPVVLGDAGIVFAEGDSAALGEELRRLVADAGLRRSLACRGRRRVEEHFTQARVVGETVEFYRRLERSP